MSVTTITPVEAKAQLASLASRLISAKDALKIATANLDAAATGEAQSAKATVIAEARPLIAIISSSEISDARAATLIGAAATDLSPAELKRIADANRVTSSASGIVLPAGRFENLSRGRGWCRLGKGSNVQWADRTDGGYLVNAVGEWVVGSTDGFSRKDSVSWAVKQVGSYWIAD